MPKVLEVDGLRFFFYSDEGTPREPIHVHVRSGSREAKVWIEPEVRVATVFGFNTREVTNSLRLAFEYTEVIRSPWHEHFDD